MYKELARSDQPPGLELEQIDQGSYLRLAATAREVAGVIDATQGVAQDLIFDALSRKTGVFQEPPTELNSASRVVLEIDPLSGHVRPRLQHGQNAAKTTEPCGSFQEYAARLDNSVYKGLKKAGRFPLSLTLRVLLGHYMLQTYPPNKEVYTYPEFHGMARSARAIGWLKSRIGNETMAQGILDFARNDSESPFLPTGNQTTSPADVLPAYAFEARSQQAKFYMPIKKRTGVNARGEVNCYLYRVTACRADAKFAELDIFNLSVGKNLDWKLEAVNEEKGEKSFPQVVRYLRSANVTLRTTDRPHDLDVYPRLEFDAHPIGALLKDVTVKTLYLFKWKTTPYVVQVAINHRWASIAAMRASKPTVDLEMSVFGECWDSQDNVAGNIWGDELQLLLEGRDESRRAKGLDRVGDFLQTVRDIRDAFERFL
ncbi:hypothetical protein GGR54DRAFT_53428 [Hypoxylon sp. NC1633]|nr:hypothetical protein GGR54DRAFT_53428 [Hypoxylon sp. NC1633]